MAEHGGVKVKIKLKAAVPTAYSRSCAHDLVPVGAAR